MANSILCGLQQMVFFLRSTPTNSGGGHGQRRFSFWKLIFRRQLLYTDNLKSTMTRISFCRQVPWARLYKSFEFVFARDLHVSGIILKDKVFTQPTAGPRKSKFAIDNSDIAKPPPKVKTENDIAKQEAAKKDREQKKKETRLKQIEIQKKRNSAKSAKKDPAPQKKKQLQFDDDDDENE